VTLRALGVPRTVTVASAPDGTPRELVLDGVRRHEVVSVRDDWLVQDLWWTDRAVDRHYFELVLDSGRLVVVYREAADASWYVHG
jgi:hypothetical protein